MKNEPKQQAPVKKRADQYNDPSHNYLRYWEGRDYEHAAEEMAIRRLLKGKRFKHAVDIGGGYGRLCVLLKEYADKVTLAEPSQQQLDIAKDFLKDHPQVERKLMQVNDLKFKDGSLDLITMIRVMHHLPQPGEGLREISRVLSKDGIAIIEVANYAHARNRLRHFLKGKPLPSMPVDIRSEANKKKGEIPFVNHNPKTVIKQFEEAGLSVERMLSVSNLRSPSLKKIIPQKMMLVIEDVLQPALASVFFGPSIFFVLKKR